MTKNRKDFIMLPTVDFCFKELMQNPKVRKGFIAALLRISPEKIRKTTLQPTILDKQSKDDKCYHTINFRDEETGELYTDLFELKILELSKLSKLPKLSGETKGDGEVMCWMRFFNGKKKEEFADMAKGDEYLGEAYQTLLKLSADEEKRLEYEAREKALRDYNSQMQSAQKRGEKRVNLLIQKLLETGRKEDIVWAVSDSEYQRKLMDEFGI